MHPDSAFHIADAELHRMLIQAVGFGMVFASTPGRLRVTHTPLVCAYVSPRWYEDRGQVPTWNYVALEMEGMVRALEREELTDLLGVIGAQHEARLAGAGAWRPDHVPAARWNALFENITGFEMTVRDWRPTFKLSQNKSAEDRARVADALEEEGAPDLAGLMRGVDTLPPGRAA